LARYDNDGTLDTAFGENGTGIVLLPTGSTFEEIKIDNNGKIILTGSQGIQAVILRYNSDGTLDTTFGSGGITSSDFGGISANGLAKSVTLSSGNLLSLAVTADGGGDFSFGAARYTNDINPITQTATFSSGSIG
jgi:uncharacterized delta-60 repeat protein